MIATVTLNPALDKCIYVDRLLPNDTNRIMSIETDIGGKGVNASRVLKELGAETIALGFIGGKTGRFIEHTLLSDGIPVDFVHVKSETRTNICVQEATGAPPTSLNEPGPALTETQIKELIRRVRKAAAGSTMVIFGGSPPPNAPKDIYRTLVRIVQREGARAVLDSDGEPMRLGLEAAPFMIKPNRDEVKRLIDLEIESMDDAVQAVNILGQTGVRLVVISMGCDGAIAGSAEGAWHAMPPQVRALSTIGAGDSMVAGIAHGLSRGQSLEEALRWGSAAGAATAMTDGTEICRLCHVLDLLGKVCVRKLR